MAVTHDVLSIQRPEYRNRNCITTASQCRHQYICVYIHTHICVHMCVVVDFSLYYFYLLVAVWFDIAFN